MPTELTLPNREEFGKLLSSKPLGDPTVGPDLPGAAIASGQSFAGDVLSVNLHGALGVSVFNSPDDKDDDGIIGEPTKDLPVDVLEPQIRLPVDKAYVKYRAEAGLKAAAAGKTLEVLGFAIDGRVDVVLTDYKRRERTEITRDAVLAGLTALRTSLKLDDVLDLAPGEAVSQQVVGRLSAAVEVSWSDVFTGPIGPLSRLAGPGAAVLVKVSGGATFKASVSLSDDFLLVFSRVDDARWRIGLRKARTRDAAIGLDLGVSVEFADPAQVEKILGAAVEGVVGESLDKVDQILAKASLEGLSPEERQLADFLIGRLGLDRAVATIETIRAKIADIRQKVKDTIAAVAKAKVELSFAYEYRRIRQDTTVAQCLVTKAGLTKHHADVVRGRFGQVFAEAADGVSGSVLEHYLYQTSIKTERSWGFALSIGKWVTIGGRDRKTLLRVDRHSVTDRVQRSFVGTRGYREDDDDRDRWSADLSASMPTFARSSTPLVSEFQTGLSFSWFEEADRLDDDRLSAWLDLAVLWGALPEEETMRHREKLAAALKKKCAFVAQLTFPHEAFSIMRTRIAAANAKEIGPCLGAAMLPSREAGRDSVLLRRRLYGPLWELYLSNPDHVNMTGRDFAATARKHLTSQGFVKLAAMEQLYAGSMRPHDASVFCGLIDLNPHTIQNCRDFFNGVKRLNVAAFSGAPDNGVFAQVFEEMENLWRQSHHVRAVGSYLVDVARATAVLKHVGRSMALTVAPGTPGEQVLVVAS